MDTSLQLIKYFDAFIGLPSLKIDNNKERRSLYGKAGAFRLTEYGLEYRSLSSAMMKDDETLSFLWSRIVRAIDAFNRVAILPPPGDVIRAINNSDVDLAQLLIDKYKI